MEEEKQNLSDNMINWINIKFGTNYTVEGLDELKNFTLLWNIYENIVFDCEFTLDKLESNINSRELNFKLFQKPFQYFRARYTKGGQINSLFDKLTFRQNDRKEFVKNVLTQCSSNNNKIFALGIIVYRLRNNLFHGIKDYRNLDGQIENFIHANKYIKVFLEIESNNN